MLKGKCEISGVPKNVKLTPLKEYKWAQANQNAGRGIQKNEEEKNELKETQTKTGWNEDEKKQKGRMQVEMVPHVKKMILGLNHPETQFGSTYLFFRNPEPRPTLRVVKVHFDRMWILKLKRFLLRKFS